MTKSISRIVIVTGLVVLFSYSLIISGSNLLAEFFSGRNDLKKCDAVLFLDDNICRGCPTAINFAKNGLADKIIAVKLMPEPHNSVCRERFALLSSEDVIEIIAEKEGVDIGIFHFTPECENANDLPRCLKEIRKSIHFNSILVITSIMDGLRYGSIIRNGFKNDCIDVIVAPSVEKMSAKASFVESRDFYTALFKESIRMAEHFFSGMKQR